MNDVLEKANELSYKIYRHMSTLETCEAILNVIMDKQFVFRDDSAEEGKPKLIEVSTVLSEAQVENIRGIIICAVKSNADDSREWLEQISSFEPKEKKNKFADGLGESEEKEKKTELSVKKVTDLYVTQNRSAEDVAKELGVDKKQLLSFLQKYKIKKEKKEKSNTPS